MPKCFCSLPLCGYQSPAWLCKGPPQEQPLPPSSCLLLPSCPAWPALLVSCARQQLLESQQEVEQLQLVLKQQERECQQYEARIDALTKERDELEKSKELAMKKVGGEGGAGNVHEGGRGGARQCPLYAVPSGEQTVSLVSQGHERCEPALGLSYQSGPPA